MFFGNNLTLFPSLFPLPAFLAFSGKSYPSRAMDMHGIDTDQGVYMAVMR
jgi:hypothetical protein